MALPRAVPRFALGLAFLAAVRLAGDQSPIQFEDRQPSAGIGNAGLLLFESDRIDEALSRFQTGLAVKPDDPDLLEMAGRCYLNRGKFKDAAAHFEKARAASTDAEKVERLDELIRLAGGLG